MSKDRHHVLCTFGKTSNWRLAGFMANVCLLTCCIIQCGLASLIACKGLPVVYSDLVAFLKSQVLASADQFELPLWMFLNLWICLYCSHQDMRSHRSSMSHLGTIHNTNGKPPNGAIHQAARLSATGRNSLHRPFKPFIHSQWTLFHSAGLVPVKIMEWSGAVRLAAL